MSDKAPKEWNARREALVLVQTIFEGSNFDNNGICTDIGSYLRCDLAAIYFDLRTESGEGEALWDDEHAYTVFMPTVAERGMLGLIQASNIAYLSYRKNGQVFGKEIGGEDYEDLKARCHSDNPDDEIVEETDKDPNF